MFEKFEEDPYDVELRGILTADEYRAAVAGINRRIKKARPGKADGALLAAGALMVPLVIWGVRRSRQMKKRKRYLNRGIDEFNAANPTLLMRWNRKPKSILTIERREGEGPTAAVAEAQFVGDMVIQAMPPPPPSAQQQQQQMTMTMTTPPTGAPAQMPASYGAKASSPPPPGIV